MVSIENNSKTWIHNFENFSNAMNLLTAAFGDRNIHNMTPLEHESIAYRFKYTWEVTWKTIRDFLEFRGVIKGGIITPPSNSKHTIKMAEHLFEEAELDAEAFAQMISTKLELSNVYDLNRLKPVLQKIQDFYLPQLHILHEFLLKEKESS